MGYSRSFRGKIISTITEVLGDSMPAFGSLSVPAVSVKPERFSPEQPTVTTTTTLASTSTQAARATEQSTSAPAGPDVSTRRVHPDIRTNNTSDGFLSTSTSGAGEVPSKAYRVHTLLLVMILVVRHVVG